MSDTILFTPYVSTDQTAPRIRAYLLSRGQRGYLRTDCTDEDYRSVR